MLGMKCIGVFVILLLVFLPARVGADNRKPLKASDDIRKLQTSEPTVPNQKKLEPAGQVPAKQPVTSTILTIKLAFKADPRLFPYHIEVDVQDKMVELGGTVTSENEKEVATHIAQSVTGGNPITNNIEVDKELNTVLTRQRDEAITRLVKEQLTKSQTLREANFEVTTKAGIVSLNGSTRFQVIILEAAQAAQLIPGVRAVRTEEIRLHPTK